MDEMSPDRARELLGSAHRSRQEAERPGGPRAPHVWCALSAGVGVAALGQFPGTSPWHQLSLGIGVLLLLLAGAVPTVIRSRRGLHGYRGRTRSDNTVFAIVALVLALCALSATSLTAVLYVALGIVAGVTYYLVLRRHRWVAR